MKVIMASGTKSGLLRFDGAFDSALLRPGEPLFVDDSQSGVALTLMPALYVGRQGRFIPADRCRDYVDACGLVAYVPSPAAVAGGIAPMLCDRAFAPGAHMPLSFDEPTHLAALLTDLADDDIIARAETTFSFAALGADKAIGRLSEFVTLRTGDIILFADGAVEVGSIIVDTRLTAALDGNPCLSFKIK